MRKTAPSTCPRCAGRYTGRPAHSRTDNHTPICPACGNAEAVAEWTGTLTPQTMWATASTKA